MMTRFLIALVSALLALSALSSSAAASTFNLGTIHPNTERVGPRVEHLGPDITSFDDIIKFRLRESTPSLTGTFVLDDSGEFGEIFGFRIDLFNARRPSHSLGVFTGGPDADFFYLNLAAGNYFFQTHGHTFPGGGAYDLVTIRNGNPAVIPIPPALLLFATALGGLGLIGYKRRRPA